MDNNQVSVTVIQHLKGIILAMNLHFQETGDINYLGYCDELLVVYGKLAKSSKIEYCRKWRIEKIRRGKSIYYVRRSGKRPNIITRYIGKLDKLTEFLKKNPYLYLTGKLEHDDTLILSA
jgi:hypothetical protein